MLPTFGDSSLCTLLNLPYRYRIRQFHVGEFLVSFINSVVNTLFSIVWRIDHQRYLSYPSLLKSPLVTTRAIGIHSFALKLPIIIMTDDSLSTSVVIISMSPKLSISSCQTFNQGENPRTYLSFYQLKSPCLDCFQLLGPVDIRTWLIIVTKLTILQFY